jgi:hypothetical protein
MSKARILKKGVRLDDWENIVTGIGHRGKDKRVDTVIVWDPLSEIEADELYNGAALSRRIVDKIPEDSMREGIAWTGLDPDAKILMENEFDRLDLSTKITEGMQWGRLYGGAAGLLLVDDGAASLSQPLNSKNIRSFNGVTLLTRWELYAMSSDIIRNVSSPYFGKPQYYTLRPRRATGSVTVEVANRQVKELGTGVRIHRSRLIFFDGVKLTPRPYAQNGYWGDSVLTSILPSIRDFAVSHSYAAASVHDFNVGVLKMDNLTGYLAAKQESDVIARMEILAYAKSMLGIMLLDKTEDFSQVTRSLTGIPDVLDRLKSRVQSETEYPHTILFNESPKDGIGGNGSGQQADYYDTIKSKQKKVVTPIVDALATFIFLSKDGPFHGNEPEDWSYGFPALFQPSEKEKADTRKIVAETDSLYVDMGADPQEILKARLGGNSYAFEIKLENFDAIPSVNAPDKNQPDQNIPDPDKD